jgi:hypothetical protein
VSWNEPQSNGTAAKVGDDSEQEAKKPEKGSKNKRWADSEEESANI